jgi:TolA-binding protein
MKTILILLSILLLKEVTFASEKLPVIDTWTQLWSLNQQEIKLLEKLQKKSTSMNYRLFELYSEESKLQKEKENKSFIDMKVKYGKKIKRVDIFKKTLASYRKAKKLAHNILRNHPKTRFKADIYYTLALNSRDFAYDNKTENYLLKSLKNAPPYSEVRYQANIGLAEFYYNKKKYKKAKKIFSKIIQKTDDSWHTKHLFNFGWCQFKTGKQNKAIYTLRDSYFKSSMEKYIDIRSQLRDSLIIFFVHVADIEGGEKFFIENEKNAYPSLLKMLKKLSNKGSIKSTEKLISRTEEYLTSRQMKAEFIEIQIEKLAIYKQFKAQNKFHAQAKSLKHHNLSKDQNLIVKGLIKNVVGLLQIRLGKGYNFINGNYDEDKLIKVQNYYLLMAHFDKINLPYYYYLQAESFYSVGQYKLANQKYQISLESYKKSPSTNDIRSKVLDSLFSSLDKGSFSKEYLNEHLIYSYENYISFWPKNDKSNIIYKKLANLLISESRIEQAEMYLKDFNKNFPKSIKDQQKIAKRVLDSHIKNKNSIILSRWIKETGKGYLNFKKSRVLQLEGILAQILFKELHKLNNKGSYFAAIRGYKKVFMNENFSIKVKSEASHHITIVYSYLADNKNALKWLEINNKLATYKERIERKKYYFLSFDRFILLQNLEGAISWSDHLIKAYCSDKDQYNDKIVTKNFEILKALTNLKALNEIQKNYAKCSKKVNWTRLELDKIHYYYTNNFISELTDFYYDNEKNIKYKSELTRLFSIIFETSLNREDEKLLKISKKILTRLNCSECLEKVLALKEFQKYNIEIEEFQKNMIVFDKTFDEKAFNSQFTKRLARVKKLFSQGDHLLKYKFYYTSLKTLDKLSVLAYEFGSELNQLSPPIKEKSYLSSFKKQMKSISSNFISKSKEYKIKASYLIQNETLFLENRSLISLTSDVLQVSNILIPAKHYVYAIHK